MTKILFLLALLSTTCFAKEIVLTKNNTAILRGPVDARSVGDVMSQLNELNKIGETTEPIFLVLQTPGGSVFHGLNLIEYMNSLRRPVHSVANFAASMGFHILQNSQKRYITKYGTIMSHRANGGVGGDIPHQVKSRFKHIVDLLEKMDEQVISRTNGRHTKKSYMELIRDEYWSVGSNAISDGFADELVNLKCDTTLNTTREVVIQGLMNVTAVFSNCPLITEPLSISGGSWDSVLKTMQTIKELEL